MSSLEAVSGFKLDIDIVQNIIKDDTHITNCGKTIILCWISSHVSAAKSTLSLLITNMKLPARELMPCISKIQMLYFRNAQKYCGNTASGLAADAA